MLTCNVMGGLGNQLFQIFAVIATAFKKKHKFIFLYKEKLDSAENVTVRNTYWDNLLAGLKVFTKPNFPMQPIVVRENGFRYQNINISDGPDETLYMMYGYYQSYKYFNEYYDMIFKKIVKIDKIKENIAEKYKDVIDFENSISMHFRIGDYKHLQHVHPIMKYHYYEESLDHIVNVKKSDCKKVLYFCEEKDVTDVLIIVGKLEKKFPHLEFKCIQFDICDWEQMILMSLCRHNVIANSTFSWWGAYLGFFENKETYFVCYPKTWFAPKVGHDVQDLFPPEWKKIDC